MTTLLTMDRIEAGAPRLACTLDSDPSPVQGSPSESSLAPATLTLVVNAPRGAPAVRVRQLVIVVPVDPATGPRDAANLAAVAPAKGCASIVADGGDAWIAASGTSPGVFVFTPK